MKAIRQHNYISVLLHIEAQLIIGKPVFTPDISYLLMYQYNL